MKKIKELTGTALMAVSFSALILGCGHMESVIDAIGISLMASGLFGIAVGATIAGAWSKPEHNNRCLDQKQTLLYDKAS